MHVDRYEKPFVKKTPPKLDKQLTYYLKVPTYYFVFAKTQSS